VQGIAVALSGLPPDKPGVRLRGIPALDLHLAIEGAIGQIAASVIGSRAKPVRAVLFDKTPGVNWALGWHQDRTITVQRRVEVSGYGPWSVKSGLLHVEPPFDLLAAMVTLRVHLDEVGADNAPLLIAPESHRFGRLPQAAISDVVNKCGVIACLAERGDVWLCATPILHASRVAASPARRRVLQIDYSADELPVGLDWLGI
jgi:ectoine hydroxylase-related dioxygenase (phytanoyl-CoA dioxygenase family)